VSRIADVGNPWLDAGIVPFSTMHFRSDPDYWKDWFPADFVTESFPGQFRNWFYSLLAMSTVLRRESPFQDALGYALVFGEDGRQMHKSWGNAIEFDEAAERMGVDVMRWMFAIARPEDNINFGWHAADEARRRLLVLWNVYSFFVTYARLAGWEAEAGHRRRDEGRRGVARARSVDSRPSGPAGRRGRSRFHGIRRARRDSRDRRLHRRPLDLVPAALARSDAGFGGSERSRASLLYAPCRARGSCPSHAPVMPFLSESIYQNLIVSVEPGLPDSVHLTAWPTEELKDLNDRPLQASMKTVMRAVDLARDTPIAGRPQDASAAGSNVAGAAGSRPLVEQEALLDLLADEVNVKSIEIIGDESELVDRRVKPLLPRSARSWRGDPGRDGGCARGGVRDPAGRVRSGWAG